MLYKCYVLLSLLFVLPLSDHCQDIGISVTVEGCGGHGVRKNKEKAVGLAVGLAVCLTIGLAVCQGQTLARRKCLTPRTGRELRTVRGLGAKTSCSST